MPVAEADSCCKVILSWWKISEGEQLQKEAIVEEDSGCEGRVKTEGGAVIRRQGVHEAEWLLQKWRRNIIEVKKHSRARRRQKNSDSYCRRWRSCCRR